MTESVAKISTEIDHLASNLLSTLDESLFFSQLDKFMKSHMNVSNSRIFLVLDDARAKLISENGKVAKRKMILEKGCGPAGHVIRTRKPYFSNNVSRDPLFAEEAGEGLQGELVIPVSQEGIVIATIHLQALEGEREFSRDDITEIVEILNNLKMPLSNMKMYLSAKHLNESLIKQIEQKEKELESKSNSITVLDSYKIEEKEIIAKSDEMKHVLALADKIADSDINCLIYGESGTGREMIAKRIHCRSKRRDRGYVSIDCSSLPEQQLEVELFGSELGDYKGLQLRSGLIEAAHGGTLFLNNIEHLTPHLQSKLNLFITEKMAFRVGGQMPFRSDARVIVATTSDIKERVKEENFREELFYSLNTMNLSVPSLRQRRDDIETLATYFLNMNRAQSEQKSLAPGAISALLDYNWPGNVRELQTIIERAYILADGMIVERDHLADSVVNTEESSEESEEEIIQFSEMTLDELEKRHICLTLDHLGGNKTKTARMLGITVKTLYNKLHSYGMISAKEC